jgi:hypothetical protein
LRQSPSVRHTIARTGTHAREDEEVWS